ncbi:MAG: c-type cytochrome domain-containing protein [Verrucomicrobiales bacterium]
MIAEKHFRNVALCSGGVLVAGLIAVGNTNAADEPTVYGNVIAPIFQAKCVTCHGPDKKKGKMAMHTFELLMKGGDSGEVSIVPNHSDQSEVYNRVILPEDDDDHMPPEGKDQLSKDEVAVIKWWIDSGASADGKLIESEIPGEIKELVVKIAKDNPEGVVITEEKKDLGPIVPAPTAEQETAIAKIQEDLSIVILPISQDNPGLTFTAVNVAKDFNDAKLARFEPIAGNLLQVNIARTQVTDAGLPTVAKMANLTNLRLELTGVTDAGLDHLSGLANLEYLNLYGTKVSDAGLGKLAGLKKLKRVYLWQTGVTEEGAKKLAEQLPEVLINLGWDKEIGNKPVIAKVDGPVIAEEPAKEEPIKEEPAPADDTVYSQLIHPVLEAKCTSCHGEKKQKGDLALHTLAALMKGGEDGEVVVAGKSGESTLIKLIELPKDDEDHMPPAKKEQLTAKEIALIKWWVDSGADGTKKLSEAQVPAEILLLK